jgi:hypothetical protein
LVEAPQALGRGDYTKIYFSLAIASAIVLGAALMHALGPATPGESGGAQAPAEPAPTLPTPLPEPPPSVASGPTSGPEDESGAVGDEPGTPASGEETQPASVSTPGAGAGPAGAKAPSSDPTPTGSLASPRSSLLGNLSAPLTPGPSTGPRSDGEGQGGGAGLDAPAIQRTVGKYRQAVRRKCWTSALNSRAPGVPTSAKVTASITVASSGRVTGVSVAGAPRGYPSLARCIESSVRAWQFPRAGGETIANVPFMFVGQ